MNTLEMGKFYYHYKHDQTGPVNNHAYEFLNLAHHTEMRGEEALMLVYRPLSESFVYKEGKHWDVRPLAMVMEPVDKPEYKGPRFIKIEDEKVIAGLEKIRDEMYTGRTIRL